MQKRERTRETINVNIDRLTALRITQSKTKKKTRSRHAQQQSTPRERSKTEQQTHRNKYKNVSRELMKRVSQAQQSIQRSSRCFGPRQIMSPVQRQECYQIPMKSVTKSKIHTKSLIQTLYIQANESAVCEIGNKTGYDKPEMIQFN